MKKIIGLIIAVVVVILLVQNTNKQDVVEPIVRNEVQQNIEYTENTNFQNAEYTIDAGSVLNWEGKTPLKRHYGTLTVSSGDLVVENNNVSGMIVFDMKTIVSEVGGSLDAHLKNEDFFDVATYPETTLVIDSYINGELQGDLTIKDTTQPVSLPVSLIQSDSGLGINGTFSIDRTLWGVDYNSSSVFADIGDKIINDQIEFETAITATKK